MPALEDYLYAMEAATGEVLSASALVVVPLTVSATGTCGVTTAGPGLALPLPVPVGEASWRPAGYCLLPAPEIVAAEASWRPAWGAPEMALPNVAGQASFALMIDAVLPALFYLATSGAVGQVGLPLPGALGVSDANRRATAAVSLPEFRSQAYACGLDSPVTSEAGSDAVVALLCQGDPNLPLAAAALVGTVAGDDALAAAMLAAVAGSLAYVSDGEGEDVWTCAAGTYFRGSGDCEDGAILLHGLLLAAGVAADRLVTVFGRVGVDRQGHAWVAYRRRCDGRWTVLDWTRGANQGAVAGLPVLDEPGTYALTDYALTANAFFTVRRETDVFFTRSLIVDLVLPELQLAASASPGARGGLTLGSAGWSCLGRSGALARTGPVLPEISATARSVAGTVVVSLCTARSLAGGLAAATVPRLGVSGSGAGGGLAVCDLASPEMAAHARTALQASAASKLARVRGAGTGLTGLLGCADCRLPGARLRCHGWPGNAASGRLPLPLWFIAAGGGPVVRGSGTVDVSSWLAAGDACPGGDALAGYVWEPVQGGGWA